MLNNPAAPLPKYNTPPVNEMVVGVRVAPLIRMRAEHVGLFWRRIIKEFPNSEQVSPLGNDIMTQGEFAPMPRFWFISADKARLIQLQRDRFLYNWRKITPDSKYPSYDEIIDRFMTHYEHFRSFARDYDLGDPDLAESELTYLNHLDERSEWYSVSDTEKIIKGFSIIRSADVFKDPSQINAATIFAVGEGGGALSVKLQTVRRRADGKAILVFELTNRGSGEAVIGQGLREWLDQAHVRIVSTFESMTDEGIQDRCWGKVRQE